MFQGTRPNFQDFSGPGDVVTVVSFTSRQHRFNKAACQRRARTPSGVNGFVVLRGQRNQERNTELDGGGPLVELNCP